MKLKDYVTALKNKKIDVIGIGVSNTPLIRLLLTSGCRVCARDKATRDKLGDIACELESMGAELMLGDGYLSGPMGDVIFRTPGLRPDLPELSAAVEKGSLITSEMEAFFEVCPCKIIAVTGSDGKTTTTSIIAELLRAAGKRVHVGGNIGTPLLCQADKMSPDDIAVLELSSFQLMTMKQSPDIAVITNLAPNHLDMHTDMEEYISAKKNIFRYQKPEDKIILNLDNEITRSFASETTAETVLFSRKQPVSSGTYCEDGILYTVRNGATTEIMKASEIFLPGNHNIENYLAAFAATDGLVPPSVQRATAMTFRGVEHRIEHVRALRGVDYFNDSIASSPSRTIAGMRSFPKKVILIAGGKDKGVAFAVLGSEIIDHVKLLVLTGLTAEKIRDAVTSTPGYSGSPEIRMVPDFKDAVITASKAAVSGDVVLLSPACTSFDRFKNFAERGDYFKEIVNGLE